MPTIRFRGRDMTPSHNKAAGASIPSPNLTISPYRSHLLSVSADQVGAREGLPGICLILIHSIQHHVKRLCIGMLLSLPGWKRTSTRWTIVPTLTYTRYQPGFAWCLSFVALCGTRRVLERRNAHPRGNVYPERPQRGILQRQHLLVAGRIR